MKKTIKSPNTYPNFKVISRLDKPAIDSFTSKYPPYVEFMFSNLVSWNKPGMQSAYSYMNGNIIFRLHEYNPKKSALSTVYSLLGTNDISNTTEFLIEKYGSLHLVPEEVIRLVSNSSNLQITPDRNSFEYIYDLSKLSGLYGNNLEHRRRTYNKFEKKYAKITFRKFDIKSDCWRSLIGGINSLWSLNSGEGGGETTEMFAFKRYMGHLKLFKPYIFGLYVGKHLVAYMMVERFNNDYVVATFSKSDKWKYPGASIYIMVEVARYLNGIGYKFMNYDVDLGLANLRMYKSLWRPVNYLKKYKITK